MKMQEGFLWGGATAANQCEGSASAGPFAFCPAGFWTNRLKNSKIRSECARMLDSIL